MLYLLEAWLIVLILQATVVIPRVNYYQTQCIMSPSDAPLCQIQHRLPPFHSFSATHCALAFDQAQICGYLYGAVQTVTENDSDPRHFFSNSMMVSRYCLPLYSSETPVSQICKLLVDLFLRGSVCDLGGRKGMPLIEGLWY